MHLMAGVQTLTKRKCYDSKVTDGQADTADVEGARIEINFICELLSCYESHNIYNADGTALFYKLLPRCTYVLLGKTIEMHVELKAFTIQCMGRCRRQWRR